MKSNYNVVVDIDLKITMLIILDWQMDNYVYKRIVYTFKGNIYAESLSNTHIL